MAAHCDEYWPCWSKTSRTARSRSTGGYRLFVFITLSSQEIESPANPGRFRNLNTGICLSRSRLYGTKWWWGNSSYLYEKSSKLWKQSLRKSDPRQIGVKGTSNNSELNAYSSRAIGYAIGYMFYRRKYSHLFGNKFIHDADFPCQSRWADALRLWQ